MAPSPSSVTFSAAPAPATVVFEAEGYKLFLSAKSKTGYMHVVQEPAGFVVQKKKKDCIEYRATGFATVVEAATWYAKYSAGVDPPLPSGGRFIQSTLSPPSATGPAIQEGRAHSTGGAAAALLPVVAWADVVQLHQCKKSSTGYKCVKQSGAHFVVDSEVFPVKKRDADGCLKHQTFTTPQEAAAAYARRVAAARTGPQQQTSTESQTEWDDEMGDVPNGTEVRPADITQVFCDSSTHRWI